MKIRKTAKNREFQEEKNRIFNIRNIERKLPKNTLLVREMPQQIVDFAEKLDLIFFLQFYDFFIRRPRILRNQTGKKIC